LTFPVKNQPLLCSRTFLKFSNCLDVFGAAPKFVLLGIVFCHREGSLPSSLDTSVSSVFRADHLQNVWHFDPQPLLNIPGDIFWGKLLLSPAFSTKPTFILSRVMLLPAPAGASNRFFFFSSSCEVFVSQSIPCFSDAPLELVPAAYREKI